MTVSKANRGNSSSLTPILFRPTFSPEHGAYIVLFVAFVTGAAAAQQWTWHTTLGLICAWSAFQAEHPLVLQIKQRRSWKPRFLLWGGIYAAISLGIGGYLYLQTSVVVWVVLGAIAAFAVDAIAVFYRKQRSAANELIAFAGVSLAAPLAYSVTTGSLATGVWGVWILNTLFFGSGIFSVKLRKQKSLSLAPGLFYHAIASTAIAALWYGGWLAAATALAFGLAPFKFCFVLWQREWYRSAAIKHVAALETIFALIFLAVASVSLLPAHLPPSS